MYLDRNGIMCDNILEFIACAYSVMTGMSKDPLSTEDDANEGIPWWGWLLFGVGIVIITVIAGAVVIGAAGIAIGALTNTAVLAGAGGGAVAIATSAGVAVAAAGASLVAVSAGVYAAERWTALFENIVFAQTGKSGGYYGERWPGDHKPDHVHLKGNGVNVRIGRDGKPLPGEKPLPAQAQKALKRLWKEFIKLFDRW